MTLRNAFGDLTTETLMRRLFNAMNVAKDSLDRMRVVVDAGGLELRGIQPGWHGNLSITRYVSGAPNSVDAREALMAQTRSNFNSVRNNRWSVT